MVVVFDEFQDIASVGGVPLIKTMRSKFQWHKNVAYIFSGSKRHMLMSIFEEYEGAFYKFARPMHLDPIPEDEFKKHLVRKYASAGGSLSAEVASKVVEAGVGYPYYIQHIAFELYQISLTPTLEDVESARLKTVEHQSHAFMNIWESVKSQLQRKYLLAVAKEPDAPQGFEFIERYGLRSPSHMSRIRKQLQKNGLIEKGRIVDPFFAHWLRSLEPSHRWESIESQIQRSYLVALAQHPGAVPDLEFIDRYNLVSRSHVQKAEGGLERKGLISKRKVIDPVFALWLRRLTIEPQW